MREVKGVTEVTADPRAKTIVVSYDHHITSAARLAARVVETRGLHGKPYESSLVLTADEISKEAAEKLTTELKAYKNAHNVEPIANVTVDAEKKLIHVFFKPVKLEDLKERGADVGPLVNSAKKIVPTVRALAPEKKS